jgi:hypothetical protein
MSDLWKSLVAGVVGSLLTLGVTYLATGWTAEAQRQQFLIERSQAFSEFLSLQYLPRSGSVPQECQTRLEECRRLRQVAIQMYLFLPTPIHTELIKSYGPEAVTAVSLGNDKNLTPGTKAFNNTMRLTREWLTGQKDDKFNFLLPCGDWKTEKKQYAKK